ncbi:MAG: PilZ domain-containing protein [Thermoanaerobaculales bacterium]|jgi:hypothetical protein|nr:PilZ domain-containing protein [Thermoanaerobaculales bacterium]
MITSSRGQVLVTGVDDPVYNAIVNVLGPLGFDIHRAPWDSYLKDHVQITPFDVVIAGLQPAGGAFDVFLRALRTRGSACQQSGVILVAPHQVTELAEKHIGHGANKVLSEREVSSKLQATVSELVKVAPRVPVTMNARIKIHVQGKPIQSFCQTQNLSSTGVLIRGFGHYPKGATIDFEISLPADTAPIRGTGTISRRSEKRTEGTDGLGIRFTSFQGSDQQRLADFLASRK